MRRPTRDGAANHRSRRRRRRGGGGGGQHSPAPPQRCQERRRGGPGQQRGRLLPAAAADRRGGGERGAVGGARVRGAGGAVVAGAADGARLRGELLPGRHVQHHRDEAGTHHGDHPVAQRLRGAPRLLFRPPLDRRHREGRPPQAALHAPGEHRHPDLRRRRLRHRLQRYDTAIKLINSMCSGDCCARDN